VRRPHLAVTPAAAAGHAPVSMEWAQGFSSSGVPPGATGSSHRAAHGPGGRAGVVSKAGTAAGEAGHAVRGRLLSGAAGELELGSSSGSVAAAVAAGLAAAQTAGAGGRGRLPSGADGTGSALQGWPPVLLDLSVSLAGAGFSVAAEAGELAYLLVAGVQLAVLQTTVQVRGACSAVLPWEAGGVLTS
jgi:hypothetical protein